MRHQMPAEKAGWSRILCLWFGHPENRTALKLKPRGQLAFVCMRCGDEL